MLNKIDFLYRSLQLATYGIGKVSPMQMHGWVLINSHERIVSEGWAPNKSIDILLAHSFEADEYTLYVSSFSKAVADLFSLQKIPNIQSLYCCSSISETHKNIVSDNVICYEKQLAEQESFINRRYNCISNRLRPYIVLKWAQTSDGFVARKNFDSKWISNSLSRKWVHKWRTEEDAILVATNTAHYDNPQLNVRSWTGKNPIRIVIDKHLRLSHTLKLFDNSQPTFCYNTKIDKQDGLITWIKLPERNKADFFSELLADLGQRQIQSVIIEGGSQLLHFLVEQELWDEARVFVSPTYFGDGIVAPHIKRSFLSHQQQIGSDFLYYYFNTKS